MSNRVRRTSTPQTSVDTHEETKVEVVQPSTNDRRTASQADLDESGIPAWAHVRRPIKREEPMLFGVIPASQLNRKMVYINSGFLVVIELKGNGSNASQTCILGEYWYNTETRVATMKNSVGLTAQHVESFLEQFENGQFTSVRYANNFTGEKTEQTY